MSQDKEPIDPTKLRYVLYARKSSEETGNQFRSIGEDSDQQQLKVLGACVIPRRTYG